MKIKALYLVLGLCLLCAEGGRAAEFSDLEAGLMRWLKDNRDVLTGLPYSHVGDERFAGWTFTYDAAVTALAWLAVGDVQEARRIVDFYARTPAVWRLGGVIEAVSFSDGRPVGRDWSVRSGANLWLGLAAFHLHRQSADPSHLALAVKLAGQALALQQRNPAHPNFGGVSMGPPGDPTLPKDQYFGYDPMLPAYAESYATEINLDAYALFGLLGATTGDGTYREAQARVLGWLERHGFNAAEQRFNRGFADPTVATDVQSWGVSALGTTVLDGFARDAARRILRYVEEHCQVRITVIGEGRQPVAVQGVDFINHAFVAALGREPLISPEWTFQLANAWQRLYDDYAARGETTLARQFAEKRRQLLLDMAKLAVPRGAGLAYPYATAPEALLGHENRTPAAGNLSAIGAAYGLLALRAFDPLRPPAQCP